MKQVILIIEEGFVGLVSDKDYDLPLEFKNEEEAKKFAEYLDLDYLIVPTPGPAG